MGAGTFGLLVEAVVIELKLEPVVRRVVAYAEELIKETPRIFDVRVVCIEQVDKSRNGVYFFR